MDNSIYGGSCDSNFYLWDNQLGYPVFVNNKNLYNYCNADLIEYKIKPIDISYDIFKKIGKYSYIINSYKDGNGGIEFSFYVGGRTTTESILNVNRLIFEFKNNMPVVVKIGDSDFEYVCVMVDVTVSYTQVQNYYKVNLSAIAIKRFPMVELIYTAGQIVPEIYFYNVGMVDSGLLVFWKSSKIGSTIKFAYGHDYYNTITVSNANLYYYHVIDGLDGKVLSGSSNSSTFENYTNNFINTDLVQFPIVSPGENKVKFTQAEGDVTNLILRYYPTFLV